MLSIFCMSATRAGGAPLEMVPAMLSSSANAIAAILNRVPLPIALALLFRALFPIGSYYYIAEIERLH